MFVEKPPAMHAHEMEELCDLAEQRELVLMPGHLLLYHPAVNTLKTLIQAGDLGDVLCVYSNRQNLGVIRKHENALLSLGVHDLSVILHLLEEEPAQVWAHGNAFLTEGVEDIVFCYLQVSRQGGLRTCTSPGSTHTRCARSRSWVGRRWSSSTTWSSSAR